MMVMFPIRYGGLHYIPQFPAVRNQGDHSCIRWPVQQCCLEADMWRRVGSIWQGSGDWVFSCRNFPILWWLEITMLLRTFYVRGFHNDYNTISISKIWVIITVCLLIRILVILKYMVILVYGGLWETWNDPLEAYNVNRLRVGVGLEKPLPELTVTWAVSFFKVQNGWALLGKCQGWNTTQLYMWGLFHKTIIRIPIKQPGFPMESKAPRCFFFRGSVVSWKENIAQVIPSWLALKCDITQVISKDTI